ncbi:MAG: hypothetical protein RIT27_1413 [Pseudomonadota bacterium]|jgi:hypothetical protein
MYDFMLFQHEYPRFYSCLAAYFPDTEGLTEEEVVSNYAEETDPEEIAEAYQEAYQLLHSNNSAALSVIGPLANRYFRDNEEVIAWLSDITKLLARALPKS